MHRALDKSRKPSQKVDFSQRLELLGWIKVGGGSFDEWAGACEVGDGKYEPEATEADAGREL